MGETEMNHKACLQEATRALDERHFAEADSIARALVFDAERTNRLEMIHEAFRIRGCCHLETGDFWMAGCFLGTAAKFAKSAHLYTLAARTILKVSDPLLDKGQQALSFYDKAITLLLASGDAEELRLVRGERDAACKAVSSSLEDPEL